MMIKPSFNQITLHGEDAETFLQGQLTSDVTKLGLSYQPTAIANLKGRIEFGLWIRKADEKTYDLVISQDCLQHFQSHVRKYGAFSKITLSKPIDIYPTLASESPDANPTFSLTKNRQNPWRWMARSIATGNYWIVANNQSLFQPQELRLHQRGGVAYNKGCYLGQEVIARIYFKSAPKAFLHRVRGRGKTPLAGESLDKVKVVNAVPLDSQLSGESGFEALVVAKPEQLADSGLTILDLPPQLQVSVGRDL